MKDKKSFKEIIENNLIGKWSNGKVFLILSTNGEVSVSGVFYTWKEYKINNIQDKVFSEVIEMNFIEAIKEFNDNNKTLKSPRFKKAKLVRISDKKRCDLERYYDSDSISDYEVNTTYVGGNIFTKNNSLACMNYNKTAETIERLIELGVITEEEKEGKWLVF